MGNKYGRFYIDVMAMHQEVTGSCLLCVVRLPEKDRKIKFVIDCGMFQEEEYSQLNKNFLFNCDDLDFVCVTHAHVDHVGRLPLLLKKHYGGNIYCSERTAQILPYSLNDCCKVLKETSKRSYEKPLYSESDVGRTLKAVKGIRYSETIQVHEFAKVTFFENGHLYGASVILVQIEYPDEETINLLFTGDYCPHNMFFNVEKLPRWVTELPLNVIIESTYGSMLSSEINQCFEDNLLEALNNKKDVIIPAFSLGRGQEVLFVLKKLQKANKINPEIALYYCGKLGIRYTKRVFMNNDVFFKEVQEFIPDNIVFIDKKNNEEMYLDSRQKIIIGSSGMGTYGPMQTLIPFFIGKNALIHFTGYCAEGTLGRRLMEADLESSVDISGISVKKRAEVRFTKEFSAHAKSDELIAFLKQFKCLNMVMVNHGSFESKYAFSDKVLNEVNARNVAILSRDTVFRLNHFGLQKSLNTKFI